MLITSDATEVAAILRDGGVVAYPTEAVWGLGCDPFNKAAVERILTLKSRPVEKGLILVAGAAQHLEPWREILEYPAFTRLIEVTERPTSWVVPDTLITPDWVRGQHSGVAIRLSQHEPVQTLCMAYNGVLVSTSANPAGLEPARSKEEVMTYFSDQLDAIYDAPLGTAEQPSQVLDLMTGKQFRA
ncbi:L-threonylcarbamoyladenylate synthase [Marinomonas ostreistagni]|uniref:L-threonylcarbamoyladenylate synthase n=1 Tax=Marinomonas ostreistagni TaxID=359209 RepID=UPI00194E4C51|nr:Sua5/YciO/YrdC/YwlC family protein [Marinomonas ostreistagni]MBM6552259.1 Sua5/YciO/YrdC/YwlC family protein [Marinomonas ostreistagni]